MAVNRKSVNVDIKFPSKQKANQELNQLLETLSKANKGIQIDLSMSEATKTFKEFSTMLDKVGKQLSNFGAWDKFFTGGAITEEIKNTNKLADAIGNLNEKSQIAKRERDKIWQNKNADASNKALEDQYKYSLKLEESINKMQSKLNTSKGNSLIDTSVIDTLQTKLNSINTNTPEKEINELNQAIKNLSSGDSNVVRLQNTISKLQNNMEKMKGKYGGLVGDSSSINQVKAYESELQRLQNTLTKVKGGEIIDGKKVSSEINQANSSFRNLETSVKNSSNALKLAQKDAVSMGSAMKEMFAKVGLASISYMAINKLRESLRNGIDAVRDMDSAMTTLRITMDGMTDSGLNNMVKQSQQLATDLSSTTSDILSIVKVMANANETVESIMNKTAGASILSNLSGINSSDTAKIILSATNQFKDLSDGSEESVMRVTDSIVALSRALKLDFADGVAGAGEGMQILGSLSDQVGASVEETLAILSATTEKTQMSFSEVSTSLKTIISRTMRMGDATGEEALKAEKALNSIGIAVQDGNGGMRDFMDIMKDLNSQWDGLTKVSQSYISDALGGARQLSVVLASVGSMDRTAELTNIALNSNGEAMKANEIYAESLEGRLNSLKNSSQIFWQNFINSDMLKNSVSLLDGLVKSLTGLQKTFGSLGISVGIITTAFLLFTNNPLKQFTTQVIAGEKSLKGLGIGLIATSTSAGVATTSVNILGVSLSVAKIKAIGLQAILTGGISLAITAVIGAVSWLVGELNNSSDSMENCETQARALSDALNDIDGERASIDRYSELSKQLQDANLEEEKKKELQIEQEDIKKRLASSENEYYWILNDSNLSEQEKIDKLNEQYALKLKIKAEELEEEMISQRKAEKKAIELSKVADEYNRLTTAISNADANGNTIYETNDGGFVKYNVQIDGLLERQKQLKDEFADGKNFLDKYNGSVRQLGEAGLETDRAIVDFDGKIKQATSSIKSSTDAINSNTQAKEQNGQIDVGQNMDTNTVSIKTKAMEDSLKSLGMTAEEVKEKIKNIGEDGGLDGLSTEDVTRAYGNATSKITELHKMIESLNQEQSITPQLVTELASKYPEMGSAIFDTVSAQEFLNNKIAEQEDIQAQAYQTMMGDNQQYYSTILTNASEAQSVFDAYASQFVDVNSSAYDFDVKNYRTLNEAKAGLMNSLNPVLSKWLSNLVGGSASQYEKDLSNFTSLAEQKVIKCLVRREICVGHVFNCR